MNKLELELKVLAGQESKAWLADFTAQIDRLEKLSKLTTATVKPDKKVPKERELDAQEDAQNAADDDEEFDKQAKVSAKKASAFDDEEFGVSNEAQDEDADEIDIKSLKAKKAPKVASKVTLDDVNDACKAAVKRIAEENECEGKEARTKVLMILQRKFNTKSVTDLDPKDYAKVIEAMQG